MSLFNQSSDINNAIKMLVEDSFYEECIYCACLNIPEALNYEVKEISYEIDEDSICKLPSYDKEY